MNAPRHPDSLDRAVAAWLDAEAQTVDARALIGRVKETRRQQRTWRRRGGLLAMAAGMAAAFMLAVLLVTAGRNGRTPGKAVDGFVREFTGLTSGVHTVTPSARWVTDGLGAFRPAAPTRPPGDVRRGLDAMGSSLSRDAAYMSGELRASFRDVLDRTGLVL